MRRQAVRKRYGLHDEPQVNVTPLIDVVFSILIMFIILAPLLELDRIELAEANADRGDACISVSERGPITLYVKRDNTVLFNQQIVEISQLTELLKREIKRHPQAKPQIFHDKNAYFGTYQKIKHAVESAGFEEMDVILSPTLAHAP